MDKRNRKGILAGLVVAAAIAVTGFIPASMPSPAHAEAPRDQGAEQFIQAQGQRMVAILAAKSKSPADRMRAFREAVNEIADVPRITRFVLGKYARTITEPQMRRFGPVFQDYVQDVYQQRLANFRADTLTVTGSLVRKPGDVLVQTTISGGDVKQPAQVFWRVLKSGSSWKVVDLGVSGVSLAITQQSDFVSTIDNHGGDIDALISRLEERQRRRGGPADN